MWKKVVLSISVVVLGVAVWGVSCFFSPQGIRRSEATVVNNASPVALYRSTDPTEMMEYVELVVVGEYLGEYKEKKPYPSGGFPVTAGVLSVDTVLKGTWEGKNLPFYFLGGEIYIPEAIEFAEREGVDRKQYQIFPWYEKDDPEANIILRAVGEEYVKPKEGQKYVLFLFYDDLRHAYFVSADRYGFRTLNDETLLYNPDTGEYEEWEPLQKLDVKPN